MKKSSRLLRVWMLSVALATLSGCDTEPNTKVGQPVGEEAKSQRYDPSKSLHNLLETEAMYLQYPPEQRLLQAQQRAINLRTFYEGSLKRLGIDMDLTGLDALASSCRAAYALAIDMQAQKELTFEAVRERAQNAHARLIACRKDSIAAEKKSDGDKAASAAALKRFASTGIVLLGIATAGQGDEQTGLALWREGRELASKDQPGFNFSWRQFFGQQQ